MSPVGCRGAKSPCRRPHARECWIRDATAARRAAFQILEAVRSGATFQTARDQAFGRLSDRDRRLAHELAAGVLRHRARLDGGLELATADPRLHDILRLGAYQLRLLARVPPYAAVSTSVALAREVAGEPAARYVNHTLRHLSRAPAPAPEGVATHPRWLVARWVHQFGREEARRLIAWNDTPPPLTLQPARWDRSTLEHRLKAAGFGVREAPFGAGLEVLRTEAPGAMRPGSLPGFAEGGFIVQDPAHALVCRYAAVPPGGRVADLCAAPGGKAVMLERLGARVVAADRRRERSGRLAETARRAGVAIRVVLADLVSSPFGTGALDAVLVDAPCSATGTMRRHPDARWRLSPRTIARAAERQRALVAAAALLVRPGGLLIYATCSLEPEENGEIVNEFLARHPAFERAPAAGAVPAALVAANGDFQTLPGRQATDGAYAARLVRTR
ncbi:MAG TPA: transcription antitermination factor NusB [Gemmatimonadales bacterium]|nr:transcription antitermination factor NusB [Gemmatimonadales bacterium]